MQLDRTHVVIRIRTLSEIGDLAMVMIRRYPAALMIGFLAGAAPWAVANACLLNWIAIAEANFGLDDEEAYAGIARYVVWMALLVILQTPAAGVLTTIYLGQAVFEHQPTWSSVFGEAKRQFVRWFWVLGIKRLAIPAMIFVALRWGKPADVFWDVVIPLLLLFIACIVRSGRPFVPEILLLEQCPLRGDAETVITVGRRSKSLHTPMASDLGGRFMTVAFVLFWMLLSALYTLIWFRNLATGIPIANWNWDLSLLLVLYPLALWTVAGISVLIRLLSYLDTRIRLEGWEVELAIRAEAMRQFGEEAGWIPAAKVQSKLPQPAQPTGAIEPAQGLVVEAAGVTRSGVST